MTEQPEWTPEQQEIIDYWSELDKLSSTIAAYMMGVSNLPFRTIRKLLSLAEIAWRDKDVRGFLFFRNIDSPSPHVEYIAEPKTAMDKIRVAFYGRMRNCCMIPLEPIFLLMTHQTKRVQ